MELFPTDCCQPRNESVVVWPHNIAESNNTTYFHMFFLN